ncbi:unnamed protein product [Cuscuta campestris]|uniref:PH domain-containing protein n=1 Tax=Cuscuta campestris TaxID=132261 RepID=A0A484KSB6_9ASTE|nr:unnamed protein product [Cuscuta campestris]
MDQVQPMFRPPETPREPMEFLARSWSLSALEISKAVAPSLVMGRNFAAGTSSSAPIPEDIVGELEDDAAILSGNPFSFASSETSQLIMERIMSQSQDVSPRTSGRLSHSSGPLNGGSLSDSPPASPSHLDDPKLCRISNPPLVNNQFKNSGATMAGANNGGGKTVGRWLKERKEKRREEARAHNAQLHAAISVAGVAAAVAAMAAATSAAGSCKDESVAKTNMAVASAATLVAAQCVEAAESMGADHEHLASLISSAVNVRSAGDIMTLTAAAATALRGAATLRARGIKEVWNMAAVIPVEKGGGGGGGTANMGSHGCSSGELLVPEENFLGICSRELLARGSELLKRTRKGDLHSKIIFVYINRMGQVMLKMKSRHAAGTITKKKKNVVIEVLKDLPAWPGRHLVEGGENFRYFGLRTVLRGVIEFECRDQREYEVWTQGVSRLLAISAEKSQKNTH